MRDYFVVGFIIASLPIAVFRPYYGLLVYGLMSYMYPNMLAWSFAQYFPGAKLAAVATIVGLIVTREGSATPLWKRESIALFLLLCWFTVTTIFAVYSWAWDKWQDVVKVIIMALVAAVLLNTQRRMKYFLLLIAFS